MAKANDKAAAGKREKSDRPQPQRVRTPKVFAGQCPTNENHKHTKVYRTEGRIRRCKCNDCGATWKLIGDHADPLKQFALDLADSLKTAERVAAPDGAQVIVMDDTVARNIEKELRELVKD